MSKYLGKIALFTIIIGVVALALNTAFGSETVTYLKKELVYYGTNNHFYIWKIDFWSYIENITLSTSDLSILKLEMPTREWQIPTDITNFFPIFGNDMAVILDYIILVINILLYPLKVGAYLLRNILAIFGVNSNTNSNNNGLAWLITFINEILGNISIPYV